MLLAIVLAHAGVAQHTLYVQAANSGEAKVLNSFSYQKKQPSPEAAKRALQEMMKTLYRSGYLLAHAKTFQVEHDTSKVVLAVGQPFSLAVLGAGNVEPSWLNQTSFREKDFICRPFRHAEVARIMEQLVRRAENSGYPFASVRLDSVRLDSASLQARLYMEKGPLILFDTIVVRGNARLSAGFLSTHLGIKAGQPYNQQTVEAVAGRLQQLPFVKSEAAPTVSFQNRQATIYVNLAQRRANRLDGVVGLLPNPGEAGRFLFTGQLDLLLQNPFGGGKQMALQWQRFSPGSQSLEISYRHPYLFGAPLSLELGFGLLKESEAFVNRQLQAAVQLKQGAYNTLQLGIEHKDSRLLGQAAAGEHGSFSLAQYGIGLNRQRINDPFLPQKGYEVSIALSGGKKKVRSLPSGVADSTIESNPAAAMQYRASGTFRYFWPLFNRLVWAHGFQGGFISDKHLFQNDLYRLGGLNSLRGFREKNFFVSDFVLSRLELRYLAASETYFFLFYDQAWMAQRVGNLHVSDWPLGFGAGLNLGTNSGTFNFVYGLGRSDTQPIGLSGSQVHFGYVNRF